MLKKEFEWNSLPNCFQSIYQISDGTKETAYNHENDSIDPQYSNIPGVWSTSMARYVRRTVQERSTIRGKEFAKVYSTVCRALELNEIRIKEEKPEKNAIVCKLPNTMKNWGSEFYVLFEEIGETSGGAGGQSELNGAIELTLEMTSSDHGEREMVRLLTMIMSHTKMILSGMEPKVEFGRRILTNRIIGLGELVLVAFYLAAFGFLFMRDGMDRIYEIGFVSVLSVIFLSMGIARIRWAHHLIRLQEKQNRLNDEMKHGEVSNS